MVAGSPPPALPPFRSALLFRWCLGLSFLHLLTGGQPYEETMEQVSCPPALDAALASLWQSDCKRYSVLAGRLGEGGGTVRRICD